MQRVFADSKPRVSLTGALTALFALAAPALNAQPAAAIITWRATEQWRVDGAEQGASGFADLRDLVVHPNGSLWTLDFKEQSIRRYDASGRFIGTTGRPGAGPGEMRDANGMLVHADGTVWINDPQNGRLTVYDADGQFARQHTMSISGFGYRWDAWLDREHQEVIDPTITTVNGRTARIWRRVGADGSDRGALPTPECVGLIPRASSGAPSSASANWRAQGPGGAVGSYPFTTGGGVAAAGRGAVWCASPLATHAVLVQLATGDTIARSALPLSRLAVSRDERAEEIAAIRKRLERYKTNDFDPSKVPDTKSGIAGLTVDDDWRLWIKHARTHNASTSTFDVHDATGAHLGRVILPVRVSSALPPRARGMKLWVPVLDDDDVVSVVHFTLAR